MIIGGIWHGAGWIFLIWGFYHGFIIALNHLFRDTTSKIGKLNKLLMSRAWLIVSWFITHLFIVYGWLLFKCTSLEQFTSMNKALFFQTDFILPMQMQVFDKLLPSFLNVTYADKLLVFNGNMTLELLICIFSIVMA